MNNETIKAINTLRGNKRTYKSNGINLRLIIKKKQDKV